MGHGKKEFTSSLTLFNSSNFCFRISLLIFFHSFSPPSPSVSENEVNEKRNEVSLLRLSAAPLNNTAPSDDKILPPFCRCRRRDSFPHFFEKKNSKRKPVGKKHEYFEAKSIINAQFVLFLDKFDTTRTTKILLLI